MTQPPASKPYSRRLSDEGLAAWRAFLRAHHALTRKLEQDLADAGQLSLSEYDVLATLVRSGDAGVRLSELAERVLVTKSGMTRLVDRLEALGYVDRVACATDRRGQSAVLTEQGRDALRSATRVHLPGVAARFAGVLDADELRALRAACERIADAAEDRR